MLERIEGLFKNPIGYMLCFSIVIFIFSLTKFFRKNNKHIGYNETYYPFYEKITIYGMIGSFVLTADFVFNYMLGVRDTNGNTLFAHIILCTSLLYIFFLEYFFFAYKRVFFNRKEIIVTNFMKRTRIYYWQDIISVINKNNDKIIVKTINGKFTIDNEFVNVKKFLKILEEKNIKVEVIS